MSEALDNAFDKIYWGKHRNVTVWHFTNIYPSAEIGAFTSIGSYTEVGPNVKIGANCKIGAHNFIPEGVTIGDNVFTGPCVCFTNDKYPPSGRENWKKTFVASGAAIGAGCVILPNITIGPKALIGAGSVVTKDVPEGETWAGNPARKLSQ